MTDLPNFSDLPTMTPDELLAAGCAKWDEPNEHGQTLWLFPREWYDGIPQELKIVDIFYNREKFKHGVTDNDHRGGFLAFGILIPATAPNGAVGSPGKP